MVSIIIPTLNEEAYLPPLLASINRQTSPLEVWVIDGSSSDRTVEVVEEFRRISRYKITAKVIERSNVARQRNVGASLASGNLLLFLDADVVLPAGFLKESIAQIEKSKIELAGTRIFAAEPSLFFRALYALYSYLYLPAMRLFNPVLHGCSLFVMRAVHERIGGFEEDVTFEDFRYSRAGAKFVRPVLLTNVYVRTSARRFYNPSVREVGELMLSGFLSIFKAGIKGKAFMKKYHENVGKHSNPRYQ